MDIMEDPVLNETGNSYERESLKEAYKSIDKKIDPITAVPLKNINLII